jgi:hypothetical protein
MLNTYYFKSIGHDLTVGLQGRVPAFLLGKRCITTLAEYSLRHGKTRGRNHDYQANVLTVTTEAIEKYGFRPRNIRLSW